MYAFVAVYNFSMYLDHTSGDCALKAYIMNAALPGGPHATEWSECSRNVIQRFLADECVHKE